MPCMAVSSTSKLRREIASLDQAPSYFLGLANQTFLNAAQLRPRRLEKHVLLAFFFLFS